MIAADGHTTGALDRRPYQVLSLGWCLGRRLRRWHHVRPLQLDLTMAREAAHLARGELELRTAGLPAQTTNRSAQVPSLDKTCVAMMS